MHHTFTMRYCLNEAPMFDNLQSPFVYFAFNPLLSSRCGLSEQSPIRSTTLRFSNLIFFVRGQTFSIFVSKIISLNISDLHDL